MPNRPSDQRFTIGAGEGKGVQVVIRLNIRPAKTQTASTNAPFPAGGCGGDRRVELLEWRPFDVSPAPTRLASFGAGAELTQLDPVSGSGLAADPSSTTQPHTVPKGGPNSPILQRLGAGNRGDSSTTLHTCESGTFQACPTTAPISPDNGQRFWFRSGSDQRGIDNSPGGAGGRAHPAYLPKSHQGSSAITRPLIDSAPAPG